MGSLSLFMDVVIMEVLQMKLSLNVHVESVVGAAAYSSLWHFSWISCLLLLLQFMFTLWYLDTNMKRAKNLRIFLFFFFPGIRCIAWQFDFPSFHHYAFVISCKSLLPYTGMLLCFPNSPNLHGLFQNEGGKSFWSTRYIFLNEYGPNQLTINLFLKGTLNNPNLLPIHKSKHFHCLDLKMKGFNLSVLLFHSISTDNILLFYYRD